MWGLSLLLKALDAWVAAQPGPKPSLPEAIRTLLAAALKAVLGVEQPTRALEGALSGLLPGGRFRSCRLQRVPFSGCFSMLKAAVEILPGWVRERASLVAQSDGAAVNARLGAGERQPLSPVIPSRPILPPPRPIRHLSLSPLMTPAVASSVSCRPE